MFIYLSKLQPDPVADNFKPISKFCCWEKNENGCRLICWLTDHLNAWSLIIFKHHLSILLAFLRIMIISFMIITVTMNQNIVGMFLPPVLGVSSSTEFSNFYFDKFTNPSKLYSGRMFCIFSTWYLALSLFPNELSKWLFAFWACSLYSSKPWAYKFFWTSVGSSLNKTKFGSSSMSLFLW